MPETRTARTVALIRTWLASARETLASLWYSVR